MTAALTGAGIAFVLSFLGWFAFRKRDVVIRAARDVVKTRPKSNITQAHGESTWEAKQAAEKHEEDWDRDDRPGESLGDAIDRIWPEWDDTKED